MTFCLAVLLASKFALAQQPNVVVILTDDQGWGDLSAHGNTNLSTPHLDSLARDGASFDHFYVCQVCAPTRAEFLTGRYHPQTGVSGVSRGEGRLNPDETTIADIFRKAGYATGAFGKWHNGTQPPYHPNDRGFVEFYGFTSGHWGHYFSPPLEQNRKRVRGNGFIIDDFTDHAISFIEANREQPFFCYVPFNTPHSPMFVPDRWYEKFDGKEIVRKNRDPGREDVMMTRAALALCENIDWNVGRILKKLDELKLKDDTIVVYFSDNGPNSYRWNRGMKGRKGSIDEGGLRSPLFVRWPQKIRAGLRIAQVGGAIDLLPTLTDLAGIEVSTRKPVNGISLAPRLRQVKADHLNRSLFSIKLNQVSVRTQRFRLDASGKLFDIAADPGQRNDVSKRYPIETRRLKVQAARFNQQMQKHFQANADRPFTVGYGQATTLTARDGMAHGTIQRSSRAPNNSFFTNWTKTDDSITWNIDVGTAGDYEATVFYTCAAGDEGPRIRISAGEAFAAATVKDAFDPPLYDKSKERVEKSHYFVKDFKPLSIGTLSLKKGRATLKLEATMITGRRAIDVQAIDLVLKPKD
jgi:arylsulfatase A-like enzyme